MIAVPFSIREWCKRTIACNDAHGFPRTTEDTLLSALMLVVTEVAEAAEAYRENLMLNVPEELADVVIRVFNIAESLGIDLEVAVVAKHEKNLARPWRHGGKRA